MKKTLLALSCTAALAGCNLIDDGETGSLSLKLTDAPVDEALEVVVTVKGVSLNFEDGGWVDYDLETPEKIDLLTLQSGETFDLFQDDEVAAGRYKVRLNLHTDDDGELDQYIVLDETSGEYELTIPSGAQTGLKLNSDIVVPANGSASYTIDFDVRQSIVLRDNTETNNGYALKPVLRIVDNTEAGTLSGVIADTSLLTTNCSDDNPLTHNVIYVFEGEDVTPDDYGSDGAQAVTTARVVFDDSDGSYQYETAPLTVGDYTVALTCNADLEDLEADDDLMFKSIANAEVTVD